MSMLAGAFTSSNSYLVTINQVRIDFSLGRMHGVTCLLQMTEMALAVGLNAEAEQLMTVWVSAIYDASSSNPGHVAVQHDC